MSKKEKWVRSLRTQITEQGSKYFESVKIKLNIDSDADVLRYMIKYVYDDFIKKGEIEPIDD